MQNNLNKNSTIFDRILIILEKKGLKNVSELAEKLGYASPQKIYRLKQEENSKPSYDIIFDLSNKFEDLNLRWFITGDGEPFNAYTENQVAEPMAPYGETKETDELKRLRSRVNELEIEKRSLLLALREVGAGKLTSDTADPDTKKNV